jgi:hypothetical protein
VIRDFLLAATFTLVCGTGILEAWYRIRYPDVIAWAGVIASIGAGPYFLWRRGRHPIIPIAAIYSVVMLIAILIADFLVAAQTGRVDL